MRRRPPIWLMGLGNLPIGVGGAVALVTTPQLLAAQGVPESGIADITTMSLVSTFTAFLLAPILDWRFSRRTYAIALALLSAALCMAALLQIGRLAWFAILLLCMSWAINLNCAAIGGWYSDLTNEAEKARVGAWLTVANLVGVGATSALAIFAIRHLPPVVGPAAIAALFLLPIPVYLAIPSTAPDATLAHESFLRFGRDVLSLLGRDEVRWLIFFLVLPAGSFALSNTMPGLGRDFHASEAFVGVVCGAGVAISGVVGSLLVPPLVRRVAPKPLYLLVGAAGAAFSVALVWLPSTPATFAFATIGENGFWAASFSVIAVIVLRSNGEHNPLAATQFALLNGVAGVPLTYMQFVDGHAYALGHVAGSYLADAGASLTACSVLAFLLLLARRRRVAAAL